MKRVLVTGATGFLGTHVVDALAKRGVDVVAFARGERERNRKRGSREDSGDSNPHSDLPSFPASCSKISLTGDVLDRESIEGAIAGCDGVIHCAGKVSRDARDAEAMRRVHVVGTRNVIDACEKAGVRRVVITSTSGVVAVSEDADAIATEDDPTPYRLVNQWAYYRSKLWAEEESLARSRAGLEVMAVCPSLLLGPGDANGSSTDDVRRFLEGKVLAIPTGGLSYVDARDAAEAMVLALEKGRGGRRYLVGACNVTLRELFARLERVSGVRGPWAPLPKATTRAAGALLETLASALGREPSVDAESLELARYTWYLDAARAERELGWTARDPIATLADTVADLRARGVVWPRGAAERGAAPATA